MFFWFVIQCRYGCLSRSRYSFYIFIGLYYQYRYGIVYTYCGE